MAAKAAEKEAQPALTLQERIDAARKRQKYASTPDEEKAAAAEATALLGEQLNITRRWDELATEIEEIKTRYQNTDIFRTSRLGRLLK